MTRCLDNVVVINGHHVLALMVIMVARGWSCGVVAVVRLRWSDSGSGGGVSGGDGKLFVVVVEW